MKKSYIKLIIIELVLFFFLILNSFVSSILSRYNLILCLTLMIFVIKKLFGYEKDRHRFKKDVIMEIIIFIMIYFLAYYLLGLIIGFYSAGNYFTIKGMKNFIIPIFITIILKEILRYMILTKSEGNKFLIVSTILLFIFLDVTNYLYYSNYNSKYEIFLFIALQLLPAISNNIANSYITIKTGYKPVIIYQLIMNLYPYIIPIVPNPTEYVSSIIQFIVPILLTYRIYLLFDKYKNKVVERDYNKKTFIPFIPTIIITVILVYFVSGYFHYYAVAIASGSMSPVINKGDMVIIEKIDDQYDKLEEGQVIAYKHENVVVVHRLINIVKTSDARYYYTKGDANEKEDQWVIAEEDIIGIVTVRAPFIGYPTVWINEL